MVGELFLGVVVVLVCLWLVKQQLHILMYNHRVRRRFRRLMRQ